MFRTVLCAAILAAVGHIAGADQAKIKIHPEVWADFQKYLAGVSSTHPGAYAVAEDGLGGIGYYCPQQHCKPTLYRQGALDRCRKISPGHECVIFADGREIVIPYEVSE